MNKIIVLMILMVNILFASSLQKDKKEAFKVLEKYATSIACDTSFESEDKTFTPNQIVYFGKDEYDIHYYYGIWYGDIGCYGGSGTSANYISEIYRKDYSDKFYITPEPIFSARGLSNLKKVGDKLEVIEYYHLANDANCCPSGEAKVILSKDNITSKWKKVRKKIK